MPLERDDHQQPWAVEFTGWNRVWQVAFSCILRRVIAVRSAPDYRPHLNPPRVNTFVVARSDPHGSGSQPFQIDLSGDDEGTSFEAKIDGQTVHVRVLSREGARLNVLLDGESHSFLVEEAVDEPQSVLVTLGTRRCRFSVEDERDRLLRAFSNKETASRGPTRVRAPMPGLIVSVNAHPGDAVASGDGLLVLEAMKMENEIKATTDGFVAAVHISAGDAVNKNDLLVEIE